jgi:hypothetical protein
MSDEPLSKVRTPSAVTGWVSHMETLLIVENGVPFKVAVLVGGVSISVKVVMYSLSTCSSGKTDVLGLYPVLLLSSSGGITLLVEGRASDSHVMIASSRFTTLELIPKWSVRRHAQK